jgi:hypothetical protein
MCPVKASRCVSRCVVPIHSRRVATAPLPRQGRHHHPRQTRPPPPVFQPPPNTTYSSRSGQKRAHSVVLVNSTFSARLPTYGLLPRPNGPRTQPRSYPSDELPPPQAGPTPLLFSRLRQVHVNLDPPPSCSLANTSLHERNPTSLGLYRSGCFPPTQDPKRTRHTARPNQDRPGRNISTPPKAVLPFPSNFQYPSRPVPCPRLALATDKTYTAPGQGYHQQQIWTRTKRERKISSGGKFR